MGVRGLATTVARSAVGDAAGATETFAAAAGNENGPLIVVDASSFAHYVFQTGPVSRGAVDQPALVSVRRDSMAAIARMLACGLRIRAVLDGVSGGSKSAERAARRTQTLSAYSAKLRALDVLATSASICLVLQPALDTAATSTATTRCDSRVLIAIHAKLDPFQSR